MGRGHEKTFLQKQKPNIPHPKRKTLVIDSVVKPSFCASLRDSGRHLGYHVLLLFDSWKNTQGGLCSF